MLHCNIDAGDNVVPLHPPPPPSDPTDQVWSVWRRWFDAWEGTTARVLEHGLRSPWLLEPGGALLTGMMRLKSMGDRWVDAWWSAFGLATRREQERALHELNRLHSRLLDLEEQRGGDPP
jgi:hypothetical protein